MFVGIYRFVGLQTNKVKYYYTGLCQEILLHQVPLTMLIVFNVETMHFAKRLDNFIFFFCIVNILQITIEVSYFKYYLDKGINLEQRIKLPELLRFKDYLKYILLSVCCGSITLTIGLTLYAVQPCLANQYEKNSKECVSCPFVLGDACKTCTGPTQCTSCIDGFYLDDGMCKTCSSKYPDCELCDELQCKQC